MNWVSFWEQFEIAVHTKEGLRDVEKLAYLKDAVKDGPAKHVIEGLSRTADSYTKAIECLRERYYRPRLIQQAHARTRNCGSAVVESWEWSRITSFA